METSKLKISILPQQFRKDNGKFAKDEALIFCGKIAGVCYDLEGFDHIDKEDKEKTEKRIMATLKNGHHSVYDHVFINLNIQNIPKMLAIVINNEKQYTTSEKSARYTKIKAENGSPIEDIEINLYNKWLDTFTIIIKEKYGNILSDARIRTLAQENARYMVSVFVPTQMVYSTTLRQINYIASWLMKYIDEHKDDNSRYNTLLSKSMNDFIEELDRLNILVPELMRNKKYRSLSLFGNNINKMKNVYSSVYLTTYTGSFAQLAQVQRHRRLDYIIKMKNDTSKTYYVPPILDEKYKLVKEWILDIHKVGHLTPQGEEIIICESGTYDNFILKCKERLCTNAQLETAEQTKETLMKYREMLINNQDPLANDIEKYTHGARCTFPNYDHNCDCKFQEGKILKRKI